MDNNNTAGAVTINTTHNHVSGVRTVTSARLNVEGSVIFVRTYWSDLEVITIQWSPQYGWN